MSAISAGRLGLHQADGHSGSSSPASNVSATATVRSGEKSTSVIASPVEEMSTDEVEEAAAAVRAVQWALSVMADKRTEQALYEMERQRIAHEEAQVSPSWWSRALESIGRLADWLPDLQLARSR